MPKAKIEVYIQLDNDFFDIQLDTNFINKFYYFLNLFKFDD